MYSQVRCPSCYGSGSLGSIYCFKCHGVGTITEYSTGGSASAAVVEIDTRTDEEKKIDFENAIAGFLGFCLGGFVVVSALMEGVAEWWVPTIMGIVLWIATTKLLQGQLRVFPILIRKLLILIGTLLAYTIASLFAAGLLYVVFKIIQEAN